MRLSPTRDGIRLRFEPAEVDLLLGDSTKAKELLKWEPKVKFKDLAKMMIEADLHIAEREKVLKEHSKSKKG